ncbi:lysozyme [Pasteurella multocida]|uniref:lysozyme n=1 Tax=Pasteurella multocida TaxID=747 RepID=UPI00099B1AC6|nr:lysozyme [Pasteurella multocida]ARA69455.1 lysozyme [Pasteurella multocida subsp. multocida]ARA89204.1 lysozyme [Pasteurella multocida subsp. septica]MCL7766950.1 lysozyme [Pasteurella multocida]MCL7777085.1 lysozyme [Pasteurella multocida]MCL7802739.1 lysozyme [Pasteurella multocida]
MKKSRSLILACAIALIIANVKTDKEIRTSTRGLELIANAEGCVRKGYKCPRDVLTVGIGSTQAGGEKIEVGKIYSNEEIAQRFAHDVKIAEMCVKQHFNGAYMNMNQFDAMTSLAFNVGCENIKAYYSPRLGKRVQTTIYKHAQDKNFIAMCERIPDFKRSGGRVLKGLQIRREKEKAHCLKEVE